MGRIVKFFLRARHWQIFLLIWGTYIAGQIVITGFFPGGPVEHPWRAGFLSEAVMAPAVMFLMGWIWSMGWFLFSISEWSLNLNIHVFRFAVVFSAIFLLGALPLVLSSTPSELEFVFIPLLLFCMCCLLYTFLFVSKTLASVEKGEALTGNEHALYFLLMFCSIIGVWLIQPKINRLYARES